MNREPMAAPTVLKFLSLPVEPMAALLVERATHPDGPLFWGVWGAYLVRGPKRELFLSSHDRLTLGGGFSRLPYEII